MRSITLFLATELFIPQLIKAPEEDTFAIGERSRLKNLSKAAQCAVWSDFALAFAPLIDFEPFLTKPMAEPMNPMQTSRSTLLTIQRA
jgi:hypothetical protein